MGISLIIMMSMLAFIVNVGLFVKAKINLQNAVDAAAFSGAATQSRQLTNIAYMNWELRNTYKEWLFKYYILGNASFLSTKLSQSQLSGEGNVDFRLSTPNIANLIISPESNLAKDPYNVPSICIHNSVDKNICPIYLLPGLPRWQSTGVIGITDIHETLVNKLVADKSTDCSARTKLNFLAALAWTYGTGINNIPGSPLFTMDRPGAWVQALEIAMRIRNLEMIVNRPPITEGIDLNVANQLPNVSADIALNERPYKAFMSAYKNLSGGKYKDNNQDELSNNFKLYELPPTPFNANGSPASKFLIPQNFSFPGPGAGTALQKSYLDLKVTTLNYALMYHTFSTTTTQYDGVSAQGSCGVSKTALPVPGYILGFVKNPEVMTYYAVKGESKFIGLFYPFTGAQEQGIKLTAYAAAKPFGGRIGPMLFKYNSSGSITPREDNDKKSKPYISGLKPPPLGSDYKIGYPIPFNQTFWVSNANNAILGGIPESGSYPSYGIPNMIYDFNTMDDLRKQSGSSDFIQDIDYNIVGQFNPTEKLGLYQKPQLLALRKSLGNVSAGSVISPNDITTAILKARRPTKYEAINYLIPDIAVRADGNTTPFIIPTSNYPGTGGSQSVVNYSIFAPLSGPSTLYVNNNEIETVINSYMQANSPAVQVYLQNLHSVATTIKSMPNSGDSATSLHANAGSGGSPIPALLTDGSCKTDVASIFNHFFKANNTACGIVPIKAMMPTYVTKHSDPGTGGNLYYNTTYYNGTDDAIGETQLLSAYFPGPRLGTTPEGVASHPLLGSNPYSTRRNYYSTKFFHMAKIIDSPPNAGATQGKVDYEAQPLLRESEGTSPADLNGQVIIQNSLKYDASTGINNKYFLDF